MHWILQELVTIMQHKWKENDRSNHQLGCGLKSQAEAAVEANQWAVAQVRRAVMDDREVL